MDLILRYRALNVEQNHIKRGVILSFCTLKSLPQARIQWPSWNDHDRMAKLLNEKEKLIKGRWGFIGGKNYHVQEASISVLRDAQYNRWLHAVYVTGCACLC